MRHVRKTPQNGKLLEWSQLCQRSATQASHYARTKKGYPGPTDHNRFPHRTKKLITPRLHFGEKVDARAYSTEDPPTTYVNNTTIECNGTPTPTEDWLRRQALASIKSHIHKLNKKKPTPKIRITGTILTNKYN